MGTPEFLDLIINQSSQQTFDEAAKFAEKNSQELYQELDESSTVSSQTKNVSSQEMIKMIREINSNKPIQSFVISQQKEKTLSQESTISDAHINRIEEFSFSQSQTNKSMTMKNFNENDQNDYDTPFTKLSELYYSDHDLEYKRRMEIFFSSSNRNNDKVMNPIGHLPINHRPTSVCTIDTKSSKFDYDTDSFFGSDNQTTYDLYENPTYANSEFTDVKHSKRKNASNKEKKSTKSFNNRQQFLRDRRERNRLAALKLRRKQKENYNKLMLEEKSLKSRNRFLKDSIVKMQQETKIYIEKLLGFK
ncbi:uncharacterized protein LOC113793532 [Dermatophagoides pteronyssinus]|nr:hypothetical protein DERP_012550 [Dermatophagoides pteronyssinus]